MELSEINREKIRNKVFTIIEDDLVLDIINKFPKDMKKDVLQRFDEDSKLDTNLAFITDEEIYGMIHKFGTQGDAGLVAMFSDNKHVLYEYVLQAFKEVNSERAEDIATQILNLSKT